MTFAAIFIAALCVAFAFAAALSMLRVAHLRRIGIYPQRGQASESDILRLFQEGYRVAAMRCHREVHKSSLRQAKQAIDHMAASK